MVLETKRLILREMALHDVDDLLEVLCEPEAMQFYPQPFDRQMTQTWIERNIQSYAQHGFGLWALILKENGKLIGDCGLVVQEVDGAKEVEIGYHVRRDLWGKGLATEAAQACRDYGFRQLGLDKLVSLINPANAASRRVAEKNGMRLIKEIEWRDKPTCVYAVERSSSAANNPAGAGYWKTWLCCKGYLQPLSWSVRLLHLFIKTVAESLSVSIKNQATTRSRYIR